VPTKICLEKKATAPVESFRLKRKKNRIFYKKRKARDKRIGEKKARWEKGGTSFQDDFLKAAA